VIEVLGLTTHRPVIVGHGANGLLAKVVAFAYNPWVISFEAPKVGNSPMANFRADDILDSAVSSIVNFYSESSIYGFFDDAALTNHLIPEYGLVPALPPNPFDTFCFMVAACGRDDRFDLVCNDVLGEKKFADIWEIVNRRRI
jgi:hypothetical protein